MALDGCALVALDGCALVALDGCAWGGGALDEYGHGCICGQLHGPWFQ